jgi:hypothetical protein
MRLTRCLVILGLDPTRVTHLPTLSWTAGQTVVITPSASVDRQDKQVFNTENTGGPRR